jgi:hypothetical protein
MAWPRACHSAHLDTAGAERSRQEARVALYSNYSKSIGPRRLPRPYRPANLRLADKGQKMRRGELLWCVQNGNATAQDLRRRLLGCKFCNDIHAPLRDVASTLG